MQPLKIMHHSALIVFAVSLSQSAAAQPGTERQINITTYMREGPGIAYRVIDEAETGQRVELRGCAKGWCQVLYGGASGYVAQNTLADMRGTGKATSHCIVNREAGYHGSDEDILCSSSAKP